MIFTSRNKKIVANISKLEDLFRKTSSVLEENKLLLDIIENKEQSIRKIIDEKSLAFPWLAEAISEFYKYQDFEIANYLKNKKHPAYKKSDHLREISLENKLLRKQFKIAQNFVQYYETLFPWITEYVGESLDELLEGIVQTENQDSEDEFDPVLKFMPKAEYDKLSSLERNQKALDRYLSSRKRPHEIGRDYERYIGYLYESKGFKVEYIGIEKGLEDLGRDLICRKGSMVEIVQCKCWASHKTIHEKHINQLYGTTVKYFIENRNFVNIQNELSLFPELIHSGQIKATFVTTTKLSETATMFASALGIKILEEEPLKKYPMIKCNVGINGEKIYHLPFDQQYDKTLIKNSGEYYALTVKEAEDKGFRRAFRWRGTN